MHLPLPPHTDNDADLAVWADALAEHGDPLGVFVSHGLRGHFHRALLVTYGQLWFDGLSFQPRGTWERGRLVGVSADGVPLDRILDDISRVPTVRALDLRSHRPPDMRHLRVINDHDARLQIQHLRLEMPYTWLRQFHRALRGSVIPRLSLHSGGIEVVLERKGWGVDTITVVGTGPLRERAQQYIDRLYPPRSTNHLNRVAHALRDTPGSS